MDLFYVPVRCGMSGETRLARANKEQRRRELQLVMVTCNAIQRRGAHRGAIIRNYRVLLLGYLQYMATAFYCIPQRLARCAL